MALATALLMVALPKAARATVCFRQALPVRLPTAAGQRTVRLGQRRAARTAPRVERR